MSKWNLVIIALIASFLGIQACNTDQVTLTPNDPPPLNPSGTPNDAELRPSYDSIRTQIFETRCFSCHNSQGDAREVQLEPWNALLHSSRDLVLPGNSSESRIFQAITRTDSERMPPLESDDDPGMTVLPLTDKEISVIKQWIDGGAPETGDANSS